MKSSIALLLLILLVKPLAGLGQQEPASGLGSLVAAAEQAQAAHEYAAAVNDYKKAVRIEPNMPELWSNLGLMQQETDDRSGAIVSFRHALHLNPALYVPNLFLGIDTLREGKANDAIPFLVKAEKINKTDPQPALALGRAYVSAGKFSTAAQELTQATTRDPNLGAAWFTLGIALLDQVEVDARRMSEEGKTSPFAGALYAESLQKQARFREAATLYQTLLNSKPQPPCLHSELGFSLVREHELQAAATEFAAESAAHPECGLAVLGQARLALESGEYQKAVKPLQELWDRDHGFVDSNAAILLEGLPNDQVSAFAGFLIQENVAITADLRNALLTAFNLSNSESASHPGEREVGAPAAQDTVSATHCTAEECYAAGHFQLCEHQFDSKLAALSVGKLRLLAECAFFTGDNQRASSAAAALERLQPNSLEGLYWSIRANERLALESLARFQQLEPNSVRSHVLLGDIYHQLERLDDAQAEYLKALALAPGDPAAMLGLASAYLSNNKIEKAAETAQSALAGNPEDPELNLIMAGTLMARNEYAEAEPYLKKGLRAKPQMLPRVHALMGKVYAETGRTQEAIDQLKMGASSDEDGSLQYLLARLYRKVGDSKDASEALDRMQVIKQQRRVRGAKTVEDPDLSSLESSPTEPSTH